MHHIKSLSCILFKIITPKSALLVIDIQNDFITGSLSSPKAHEVIQPINYLLDSVPFSQHWYSFDWHPADHISFIENLATRPLETLVHEVK